MLACVKCPVDAEKPGSLKSYRFTSLYLQQQQQQQQSKTQFVQAHNAAALPATG
jgi:hypothetical protein